MSKKELVYRDEALGMIDLALDETQTDYIDQIINEDGADNPHEAVVWCIDACRKIEERFGVDAMFIATNATEINFDDAKATANGGS